MAVRWFMLYFSTGRSSLVVEEFNDITKTLSKTNITNTQARIRIPQRQIDNLTIHPHR